MLKPHSGAARALRNVRVRVDGGALYLWADKLTPQGRSIRTIGTLIVAVPLALVLLIAFSNPGMKSDDPLAIPAVILLLVGIAGTVALPFVMRFVWSTRSEPVASATTLTAITRCKVGMNWDLGCALAILLSPIGGLIYLLTAGANVVTLAGPLDPARGAQTFKFRPVGGKQVARRLLSAIEIERDRT